MADSGVSEVFCFSNYWDIGLSLIDRAISNGKHLYFICGPIFNKPFQRGDRLCASESDVTYEDDPRTERIKISVMAADP